MIDAMASYGAVCSDKPSPASKAKRVRVPAFFVHYHPADDRAILVRDEVFWIEDFSGKVFMGFFWHGITE